MFKVKWKLKGKRTAENKLLFRYCRKIGGVTFTEVRLGEGAKARRVDAVRFLRHRDKREIIRYQPKEFDDRLSSAAQKGEVIEVIEVKKTLNRSALGQVIYADWWFRTRAKQQMTPKMTIVCKNGVDLLQDFCRENKITVWSPGTRRSRQTIAG